MKIYSNPIIQRNYLSFLNQTNNIVWYASCSIPLDHQQRNLSSELKSALNLNENLKTFYDYQLQTGYGYSRIQFLAVISICSDVEFLLKDICENIFGITDKGNAYFQKFDLVNTEIFIPK